MSRCHREKQRIGRGVQLVVIINKYNIMAETKVLIDNKAVPVGETKVVFGAVNSPTPEWAKWFFRVWSLLSTMIAAYIAATSLIPTEAKVEIGLILKVSDPFVLGLSKLFGIVEK